MKKTVKWLSLAMALTLVFGNPPSPGQKSVANASSSGGITYYFDSAAGSDSNSGTAIGAPWKSLEKLNAVTLGPGDKVLLKAGSYFTGQLTPKGSGAEGNPIVIDKYGEGAKPIIAYNDTIAEPYYANFKFDDAVNTAWTAKKSDGSSGAANAGIESVNGGKRAFLTNGTRLEQTITDLQPYTTYKIGVAYRLENYGEEVRLGAKQFNSVGDDVYTANKLSTGLWGGYEYHSIPFTTGNSTTAVIYLEKTNSGTGKAFADDLYLSRQFVLFHNNAYIEVNNLEITGMNNPSVSRGIAVNAQDIGELKHVYIRNTYVRDIAGSLTSKDTGGIHFDVSGNMVPTRFSDARIENNVIRHVDRTAISTGVSWWTHPDRKSGDQWYPHQGVVIRNNTVDDIGGDGIVPKGTDGALVEYNTASNTNARAGSANVAIWPWAADNTVIQYNEAYLTRTTWDGQGFDSDYQSNGTIIQYNYSHDNEGGFVLICAPSQSGKFTNNTIIRYNISQNDRNSVIQLNGNPNNTHIYNNTIYVREGLNSNIIASWPWNNGWPTNTTFTNNIFYNLGSGGYKFNDSQIAGNPINTVFENNIYYGNYRIAYRTPGDTNPEPNQVALEADKARGAVATADPQLASPGTGGLGINTVDGYKLVNGSPAIGSGLFIANNGGKDYWGNPVGGSAQSSFNIGAYGGSGVTAPSSPVPTPTPTPTPSPTPTPPAELPVVGNGGLESGGLSPWTNWQTASVVNSGARSGSYALKLNGGPGSAEQVVTVQPNTTYVLKGYGKTGSASEPVQIGVKNYGGSQQSVQITSASYVKGEVEFTTGPSNTAATIFFYKPAGASAAFGDDFSVNLKQLVVNEDFETGSLSPWTSWQTAGVVNSGARSGSYALKLDGGPGSAEQVITVEPNTAYVLSGYGKTGSANEPVQMGVKNYGGNQTLVQFSSTTYTKGELSFTTGASSTTATIFFYKPSGASAAWGDDFVVKPRQMAVNGGFESGVLSPWTNWQTASVASSGARSGSYALKLNGGPGSAEQVVAVEPNTTYVLSGYGKTASASEPVQLGVKHYGGNQKTTEIASVNYTKGEFMFTTGASSTTATIFFYKPSGASAAWGDDISLLKQ
ncbi:carbohydrate binding domain-containing protein [Paenibacillus pasadenensis]|uniref:carbohydrate binding domain-containing protein n=1 Tax=Paenibacillus pasadenensis TaxID=217090 RepID=UPI00204122CD|nr:carbohydrate binding domain-containing protein [Paenibacillus pasadenensis]MCM3746417.1 carbohydrate binding domain-containing protein [Paenibacillus pasadenensis]